MAWLDAQLQQQISVQSHMTAKHLDFTLANVSMSKDAPGRELIVYATFAKNAKGLDQLSRDSPRWIVELSVRQWRNLVREYSGNLAN